jgi:hypothetical protein
MVEWAVVFWPLSRHTAASMSPVLAFLGIAREGLQAPKTASSKVPAYLPVAYSGQRSVVLCVSILALKTAASRFFFQLDMRYTSCICYAALQRGVLAALRHALHPAAALPS